MIMRAAYQVIFARFLGTLATQILSFYGFFQAYSETKSPYLVGFLGVCMFIPSFIFSLKVGLWVDSVKRIGRSYIVCLALGVIPVLILLLNGRSYGLTVLTVALLSMLRTVKGPLYYSMLKSFSPDPSKIAKWNTLSWQIPLVLGSALVSLFHSLDLNLKGVLILALALQGLSLALVLPFGDLTRTEDTKRYPHLFASLKELNILKREELFYPLFADAVLTGFLGLGAMLPFLLTSRGEDALNFGYYKSIFHLFSLLAVVFMPSKLLGRSSPKHFVLVVFFWSCGVAALAVSQEQVLITIAMGSLGAIDGVSAMIRDNLMFSLSQQSELGRISSLNNLLISAGDEFGEFNTGWMIGNLGINPMLTLSSAVSLAVAVYLRRTFREPELSSVSL